MSTIALEPELLEQLREIAGREEVGDLIREAVRIYLDRVAREKIRVVIPSTSHRTVSWITNSTNRTNGSNAVTPALAKPDLTGTFARFGSFASFAMSVLDASQSVG